MYKNILPHSIRNIKKTFFKQSYTPKKKKIARQTKKKRMQ